MACLPHRHETLLVLCRVKYVGSLCVSQWRWSTSITRQSAWRAELALTTTCKSKGHIVQLLNSQRITRPVFLPVNPSSHGFWGTMMLHSSRRASRAPEWRGMANPGRRGCFAATGQTRIMRIVLRIADNHPLRTVLSEDTR